MAPLRSQSVADAEVTEQKKLWSIPFSWENKGKGVYTIGPDKKTRSGKSKVLVFVRVWSFNVHPPYILSTDALGDFSGMLWETLYIGGHRFLCFSECSWPTVGHFSGPVAFCSCLIVPLSTSLKTVCYLCLELRVCVAGRMPISGLRPEIGKNRRKIDFGLTRKMGKKSPKNRKWPEKPIFEPCSLSLGDFFPIFRVRPKSIFRRFFSDSGRGPEIGILPGTHNRKSRDVLNPACF